MIDHVQKLSVEEAHIRLQQVQDSIEKFEKYIPTLDNRDDEPLHDVPPSLAQVSSKGEETVSAPKKTKEKQEFTEKASQFFDSPAQQQTRPHLVQTEIESKKEKQTISNIMTVDEQWAVSIEELANLKSYQIILSPLTILGDNPMLSNLEVSFETDNRETQLKVGNIFFWALPGLVENYRASKQTDYLSIRLQMDNSEFDNDINYKISGSLEKMECTFCSSNLLTKSINRVVPLPSGHWEEITDYLLCYPGQPIVDFGKTIVPTGAAWEDASVWVLHPEDIDTVAVLKSVDPYGTLVSPKTSSSFSWLPAHSNAGDEEIATLCCNYCCAPLGIATQQGYHLYKHRLSNGCLSLSVARFVAHQLKRYAESQAIFTFVVIPSSDSKLNEGCLLLHILSWDNCRIGLTTGSRIPAVKLIYQQLSQLPAFHFDEVADLTSWTWGGLDLCCAPGAGTNTSKAKSVTLSLDFKEWKELSDQLIESFQLFPKEIVDATVLVKLGKGVSGDNIGLAMLDLH